MASVDAVLNRFFDHPGVVRVILLGRDGLVVRHIGPADAADEPLAARIPALVAAADALGSTVTVGALRTAVLELESGVLIVQALSSELSVAVVLDPTVGFAPLLADLRARRRQLLHLL